MKVIIEKELCSPIDPYNIPGPLYHVVKIDDETGEREVLQTFEKDIREAAAFAQRTIDFDLIQVAYKENPNSFRSNIPEASIEPIIDIDAYDGEVVSIQPDHTAIKYEDSKGNTQTFFTAPEHYKLGDKVQIMIVPNIDFKNNEP